MSSLSVRNSSIPDVKILEPQVFRDGRGFFMESWNRQSFRDAGLDEDFVQDNYSRSVRGTLRGLHYQLRRPQGKLVRVTRGEVLDVVVDMRLTSQTFGQWTSQILSEDNLRMLWVPPGFAHGFLVLTEFADFQYKCTDYYAPEDERSVHWNDPALAIDWGLDDSDGVPTLSDKDRCAPSFQAATDELRRLWSAP